MHLSLGTNWPERTCFPDGVTNEDNDFRRADSQGPEEVAQGSGEEEANKESSDDPSEAQSADTPAGGMEASV